MVELKYGKTEGVKGGGGRIRQIYLNNKLKLKEYNIQDTTLLYELNKKLKFLELHLIGAEDAVCSVDETMYNAGMNDYYALRSCKEENIVADSTPTGEEIEHRKKYNNMIGGGYTRGHLRGFFKNAWVEDFESLYPSIEISCNISAESFVANVTIDEEKQYLEWTHKGIKSFKNKEELLQYAKQYNYTITPSDKTYVAKRGKEYYHPYRFYKGDKIAILPKLMLRLIDERRALKKQEKQLEKQMTAIKDEASEEYKQIKAEWDRVHQWNISKKYVLVSNYGLQGSIYYRFFNYDVIDSITSTGRYLIKQVNELARKNGLDVIYNDTDSACLIKKENGISSDEFDKLLPGYLDEIAKGFNNTVFKRTDDKGVHTHHFGMEHEKDYDTILYVKKKRYAHCSNGKIKIVGLESTQMNVLADQIQREFLQDILLERFNKQQWKDKLDNLHKKCFGGQLTAQELSISKKYAKKITEYSGDTIDKKTGQSKIKKDGTIQIKPIPSHIELVKRMLEQGKEIFVGDKIVYIIKSTAPRQQAISIEEYEQNPTYDKEYYWGAITRPILQLMGLYMGKEVFEIIRLPEREKLLEEIKKEGGQQRTLFGEVKQSKTQERLDKLDASILENAVDENEIDDYIYPTSPTYM